MLKERPMPQAPDPSVRREIEEALAADTSRLGDVYRLTREGLTPPLIAERLGVDTANFVSNKRGDARAMLDGALPSGPARIREVSGSVRRILGQPQLSVDSRTYLQYILNELGSPSPAAGHARVGTPKQRRQP